MSFPLSVFCRRVLFSILALLPVLFILRPAEGYHQFDQNATVIGRLKTYTTNPNESLIEIARKFGIGYNEIVDANPDLDPFVPGPGESVIIPTAWILPEMPDSEGILINLSEMRLYYFPRNNPSRKVWTFPIGIGDEGTDTPLGIFRVVEKVVDPPWNVPESIRQERPELPKVVPPGPDNPLGSHALRLSSMSILIHGTNRPYAVGRRASHGCIRMYPEDIPALFRIVPKKTSVYIVKQPVKVGLLNQKIYLEVHKDISLKDFNYFDEAVRLLRKNNLYENIDKGKMLSALREKRGMPVVISPSGK
ncbi:MAG: L,D-transpeptidase family protein [Nitrospirota bacterium]